jgi:hypothetical protein
MNLPPAGHRVNPDAPHAAAGEPARRTAAAEVRGIPPVDP